MGFSSIFLVSSLAGALMLLLRSVGMLGAVWLIGAVALGVSAEKRLGAQETEGWGLERVVKVHLELAAAEFDAMQPPPAPGFGGLGFGPGGPGFGPGGPGAPGFGPGGGGPGPREVRPPEAARERERNVFGTEFPWAAARVTVDDVRFENAQVRYAGDITYVVSARGLKRPLKIRLGDQAFDGITAFHLHAMPLDPSKAREAVALAAFRAIGVPAPRSAFAEVTLTVPGRFEREFLGLYTLVEDTTAASTDRWLGARNGLVMRPAGMRGLDYLGQDWAAYQRQYQPHREATAEEQQRVIELVRLIYQAPDDEFHARIDSLLDLDAFLRFLAANALTANLESFFALGTNYSLYLHPETHKFYFLPGDLEFSLANFLLMGSAEELMDLRITKPYPGENRIADRLLAHPPTRERYLKLVSELASTTFTKEQLLENIAAVRRATGAAVARELEAARVRGEPPAGFGGPPGAPPLPAPPDLETFADRRTRSIAEQLAGSRPGFEPRPFGFGPPAPPRNPSGPISEQTFRENVEVPDEFDVELFAAPPQVSYPVAIATSPTGEIYVASDEQGSLGRTPGGGKILRCVDEDDDGRVDRVTVFASVDHPRGVFYRDGSVWVMHPPTLSVFRDLDGDGVADTQEELVTGLTTSLIDERGGDHTTNCVRMGIDGWLYIGVGDYGIKEARGRDGRTISLRGGGVVRVRPDGTELEIYCRGLRNPFDLAIDPFVNLFTRDNTNDGAGWDTRIMHLLQSAQYGYTQLYANFTDEIMPPLGTYGGGGGTGALYLQNPYWPAPYRDVLLTGDWGRSEIYRHELHPNGPTFELDQQVFVKLPRATGMDIDTRGRLYAASWWGGEASVFVGPHVGFIARITPKNLDAPPPMQLKQASFEQLIEYLADRDAVRRLHAQGEILARGRGAASSAALMKLASAADLPLEARVAAVYTLQQLDGVQSRARLLELARDPVLRPHVLRALTDRAELLEGLEAPPFLEALADESPLTRAQALISLARLGIGAAAPAIVPLTSRPAGSKPPTTPSLQNQPDPDRVIPHLAVQSLVALRAIDACLEALDGPHWQGALWALRHMHEPAAVEGLIERLRTTRDAERRREILTALIRLYHREADYDGSWWGIRPDNTGPYYDRVEWEMSRRIAAVVTAAVLDSEPEDADYLKRQLARHLVSLPGIELADQRESAADEKPIELPAADPNNPRQIGNLAYDATVRETLAVRGDAARGEALFRSQSCIACHTTADGQKPKGPHLADIGKRYKPEELLESILRPSAKLAQGYETYVFEMTDGRVFTGFVVGSRADAVMIREPNSVERALARDEIESRTQQAVSAMPEQLVANLTPEQLADLIAYLQSL